MPISQLELNNLEHFFNSIELPKQILLYQGVKCNDVPAYIKQTISNLRREGISETVSSPRIADLRMLKELLSK